MRRILLLVLGLCLSIQGTAATSLETKNDFYLGQETGNFESSTKGEFKLIAISPNKQIFFFNKTGRTGKINPPGGIAPDTAIDPQQNKWLIGARMPQGKWLVTDNKGQIVYSGLRTISHDKGMFFDNETILSLSSVSHDIINYRTGQTLNSINLPRFTRVITKSDVDGDGEKEYIGKRSDSGFIVRIDKEGLKWRKNGNVLKRGFRLNDELSIHYWNSKVRTRYLRNGSVAWEKGFDGVEQVAGNGDQIYVFEGGKVHKLTQNGSKIAEFETESAPDYSLYLPEREYFVLFRDGEVLKLQESNPSRIRKIKGVSGQPELGQYDSDPEMEILVPRESKISVFDLKGEKKDYSGQAVFGTGKSALKAISTNATVYPTRELALESEETNPVKASSIEWGSASGKKVYIDDREKAAVLAPILARKNRTLTFDRDEAEIDFSNYTVEDLQRIMVENKPRNHLALADLDDESGVLASYMALDSGYVPVNSSGDPEEIRERVKQKFERIGWNRETAADGRYISILEAPSFQKKDPVDQGVFNDPRDGKTLKTDLIYGNLDGDYQLEASVGRYPGSVDQKWRLYQNSFREVGGNATVASSYLYDNWQTVLATGGGGLFTGNAAEEILERQGYSTEHYLEYRAEPVQLLVDLVGAPDVIRDIHDKKSKLTSVIGSGSAELVENAALIYKGLEYAERALRIYHEYEWDEYDPTEVDVPDKFSASEVDSLLDSLLPDRHPRIKRSSVKESLKSSKVFFYSGKPSAEGWKLGGEEVVKGSSDNGIVFDTSGDQLGITLMRNGASSYVGFRGISYHAHSSKIGLQFLKHGKTSGNALKKAVNELRSTRFVYSPTSTLKTGVKRKMSLSPVLYGNPETPKDPYGKERLELNRTCEAETCTVKGSFSTDYRSVNGSLAFNSTSTLRRAFRPGIPVYRYEKSLPEGSEVLEAEVEEEYMEVNSKLPRHVPRTSSGTVVNRTIEGDFPSITYRINATDSLDYLQAGARVRENQTEVLQSAQVEIKYERPLGVEIERKEDQLYADLYSDTERSLEVILVGENSTKRTKTVVKGRKTLRLEDLDPGVSKYRIQVFNSRKKASDSEKFVLEKRPEKKLEASDLAVSEYGRITLEVENTNEFRVNKRYTLRTAEKLIPALKEERERKIKLNAGETRRLSWKVIPIQAGRAEVSVAGKEKEMEIDSRNQRSLKTSIEGLESISRSDVKITRERGKEYSIEIETRSGRILIERNSTVERAQLKTPRYTAERINTPETVVERYSSPKGSYIKTSSGIGMEGVSRSLAEDRIQKLERLLEKMEKGQK